MYTEYSITRKGAKAMGEAAEYPPEPIYCRGHRKVDFAHVDANAENLTNE